MFGGKLEGEAIDGYGEKRNLDVVGRMVEAPSVEEACFLEGRAESRETVRAARGEFRLLQRQGRCGLGALKFPIEIRFE